MIKFAIRASSPRISQRPRPTRSVLAPPRVAAAWKSTLTGGKLKGLMVDTIARQLGITFGAAEALAVDCAERSWLAHEVHAVALYKKGDAVALKALKASSTPVSGPRLRDADGRYLEAERRTFGDVRVGLSIALVRVMPGLFDWCRNYREDSGNSQKSSAAVATPATAYRRCTSSRRDIPLSHWLE